MSSTTQKGSYKEMRARLFSKMHSERTRSSGHKLQQRKFWPDIGGGNHCENIDGLEQIAQRGSEISIPSHETEPSAT